jgi:hypothetical protein
MQIARVVERDQKREVLEFQPIDQRIRRHSLGHVLNHSTVRFEPRDDTAQRYVFAIGQSCIRIVVLSVGEL